jgi:hypothetical protein
MAGEMDITLPHAVRTDALAMKDGRGGSKHACKTVGSRCVNSTVSIRVKYT